MRVRVWARVRVSGEHVRGMGLKVPTLTLIWQVRDMGLKVLSSTSDGVQVR